MLTVESCQAFKRIVTYQHGFVIVSKKDLQHKVSMPVGIAPTAMQRMAHPQGECATAAAAQKAGALFILSTISTSSIEEVAAAGLPTSAANFFPPLTVLEVPNLVS